MFCATARVGIKMFCSVVLAQMNGSYTYALAVPVKTDVVPQRHLSKVFQSSNDKLDISIQPETINDLIPVHDFPTALLVFSKKFSEKFPEIPRTVSAVQD